MRYINIEQRNEWRVPKDWNGILPEGVQACDSSHWFFSALPIGKMIEWTPEPNLVDIPEVVHIKEYSLKQFIELFSIDELRAIYTHSESVIDCRIWLDRLTGADYVVLHDEALIVGMMYFVSIGLITQERFDVIMDI